MNIQNLKNKLPYPLKQGFRYFKGCIPLPLRYGKVFRDTYKFLQESQWWDRDKLEEYQFQQLEKLLNHAYANVPYYRKIFNERGLTPRDIQNFDDLRKLPYLTKDIIRENLSELIAQNYPKSKLQYVTTGGSTGIPLGFYWEKGITDPKEWAFVWRQWNWAGYRFGDKSVILRGNVINRIKDGKKQLWEYQPDINTIILSSFDMTDENMIKYFEKLKKIDPVAIQGYPSSLYIMAVFLKNRNLRINNIKCILTSSETLYPHQREVIEKSFGAKIWDHYGNSERNASTMQCEKGEYHIILEYGIIELIGNDNKPVNKENDIGEIIATGFNNYAMPFIRYKTGDIAVYSKQKCSCGRNYPLLKRIYGRVQEFVVTKEGNLISLGPAIFGIHDDEWTKIKQIQFLQEERGKLIIQIVKTPFFSEVEACEYVLNLFRQRFKGNFKLELKFVDHIPRTRSGKYRFLIQKLPIEFGNKTK